MSPIKLAQDPLVEVEVRAMPREELPASVDLDRGADAAAVPAMDARLVREAAWIARIARLGTGTT